MSLPVDSGKVKIFDERKWVTEARMAVAGFIFSESSPSPADTPGKIEDAYRRISR